MGSTPTSSIMVAIELYGDFFIAGPRLPLSEETG